MSNMKICSMCVFTKVHDLYTRSWSGVGVLLFCWDGVGARLDKFSKIRWIIIHFKTSSLSQVQNRPHVCGFLVSRGKSTKCWNRSRSLDQLSFYQSWASLFFANLPKCVAVRDPHRVTISGFLHTVVLYVNNVGADGKSCSSYLK